MVKQKKKGEKEKPTIYDSHLYVLLVLSSISMNQLAVDQICSPSLTFQMIHSFRAAKRIPIIDSTKNNNKLGDQYKIYASHVQFIETSAMKLT